MAHCCTASLLWPHPQLTCTLHLQCRATGPTDHSAPRNVSESRTQQTVPSDNHSHHCQSVVTPSVVQLTRLQNVNVPCTLLGLAMNNGKLRPSYRRDTPKPIATPTNTPQFCKIRVLGYHAPTLHQWVKFDRDSIHAKFHPHQCNEAKETLKSPPT